MLTPEQEELQSIECKINAATYALQRLENARLDNGIAGLGLLGSGLFGKGKKSNSGGGMNLGYNSFNCFS